MIRRDVLVGGMYGLLIGDALGVPYEFKNAIELPDRRLIDMDPPEGFQRSWSAIKPGTYSDDGAQALVLLEHLLTKGNLVKPVFARELIDWMDHGYMSVDRHTFDVGNQTGAALRGIRNGDKMINLDNPDCCGNGSLMRSLPVALVMRDRSVEDVSNAAITQSAITHPYKRVLICVVLYTLLAKHLINGYRTHSFDQCLEIARTDARKIFNDPQYHYEWDLVMAAEHSVHRGSGYVVDSLWTSIECARSARCYADAVKHAVSYGNDTDTTACIAGGLAGLRFGIHNIPDRWVRGLRGDNHQSLIHRLVQHDGTEV